MECNSCGHEYSVREDMDPTPLCDQCAHKAVEALRELVALKDLKERIEAADMSTYSVADAEAAQAMADEYARRKPLAWQAARDVLGPNEK